MDVTQAVAEVLGKEVTNEQARSIAKLMESKVPRKGKKLSYVAPYCYGGQGKVFPLRTWVDSVEMKAGDLVKYSKPAKGEEGFIFKVIEGPYENGRVHILCINSDLPIPNVEVVMKEDVQVI